MRLSTEILIRGGLFFSGLVVGAVSGVIFVSKKTESKYRNEYEKKLNREVDLMKKHWIHPDHPITEPVKKEEQKIAPEMKKTGTSSLDSYKARTVENYTPYSRVIDDISPAVDGDYLDGKADTEKLNKIGEGSTRYLEDEYDDAADEDKEELYYYMVDDILATEDHEVLDAFALFGSNMSDFCNNDEADIVLESAKRPGHFFKITKMAMAFYEAVGGV